MQYEFAHESYSKKCDTLTDVSNATDLRLILNKRYISGSTSESVSSICKDFLKRHHLAAFEFAKVYNNGECFILYSDSEIASHVIKEELHITAHVPEDLIQRSSFWYVCPEDAVYTRSIAKLRDKTGASSFVDYIRKGNGYYEMFSFISAKDMPQATNQFLDLKEEMEQFSVEFKDYGKCLIKNADQDRFVIPLKMRPNFKGFSSRQNTIENSALIGKKIKSIHHDLKKLNSSLNTRRLSQRELECVSYLFLAHTAKATAEALGLSVRTVEGHLDNVKSKLSCRKKSEIISKVIAVGRESGLI